MSPTHESPKTDSTDTYQVPHSGVHGDEHPIEEFDTPLADAVDQGKVSTDAISVTATPPAHDRLDTVKKPSALDWMRRHPKLIGGVAATLFSVTGAGTYAAKKINEINEPLNDSLNKPSVSGPAVPGEKGVGEVKAADLPQIEYYGTEGLSAEESRQPAVLTEEQVSDWNSEDIGRQNNIVDEAGAQRLETALNDIYWLGKDGKEADVSYITTDSAAVNALKNILNHFEKNPVPDSEAPFFFVYRNDQSQNPAEVRAEGPATVANDEGKLRLIVARATMSNPNAEVLPGQEEDGSQLPFVYDNMHWAVADGTLQLATH